MGIDGGPSVSVPSAKTDPDSDTVTEPDPAPAVVSEKLLQELDQMTAERPAMIKVRQAQFNEPEANNLGNLHARDNSRYVDVPLSQQCKTKMMDMRLNAELFRLRKFKHVAQQTASFYNKLAAQILAEHLQEEPLVIYMLGKCPARCCFFIVAILSLHAYETGPV